MKSITGAVLIGGKSSRFGEDKYSYQINGKTMLQHQLLLLESCFEKVLISSSDKNKVELSRNVVLDRYSDLGPISGIYTLLNSVGADSLFVLSCDVFGVNKELVKDLCSEIEKYDCVILENKGRLEPLISCYKKTMLSVFKQSIKEGDYKLLNSIKKSNFKVLKRENIEIFNINYKEDLKQLNGSV